MTGNSLDLTIVTLPFSDFTFEGYFVGAASLPGDGNLYISGQVFDGGTQYYYWRTSASTPAGPYTQSLFLDTSSATPAITNTVGYAIISLRSDGSVNVFFNAADQGTALPGRYALLAPPIPTFIAPISGGGPSRPNCKRINRWDLCIEDEIRRLKRMEFAPPCPIPQEYVCSLPWDDEYGAIPYQAVPFNIFGSIVTPTAVEGDVLVCTGTVPLGYDGLLTAIYQTFQGSGLENGNGDILWRIQINQRYLLGLSNNPFAMGGPIQPLPLTEGQILLSGQKFRYFVNVPNTSGSLIIAGSRVVCGMLGFYWPR